jgi:hypothetical protein
LPKYEQDDAFERMLAFVQEYASVVDEVALFDSITHHLYVPLAEYAPRMAMVRRRMEALRCAGVRSVGINVLTTLGHINEAWDTMPRLPFQPMIGHDGSVSTGCACPNSAGLREYVRAKYTLAAQAGPDFIWVDDDIRMQNHGVAYACFCPLCLEKFAQMVGRAYTREELVGALDDPAGEEVRRAWVEQNVRSIESLLSDVEQAIHQVNPDIVTGLMTAGPGWTTYSGMAFERWMRALKATKMRPGGGFYSDAARLEILDKAFDVGRQRAARPSGVADCQYELENFPYQTLKKSASSVINEGTLALAAGLNGVAFNALGMWEGALDDFAPLARRAQQARPMWETLARHCQDMPTRGLWITWTPQLMARRKVQVGERWFANQKTYDFPRAHVLAQIGLPLSVEIAPEGASVLYGRVIEAFDDDQLRQMLAHGVLMDSAALDVLTARGLGHLAGVRVTRRIDNGAMERLTDDPLNGLRRAEVRDARIEFWGDARGMADVLEPLASGVRVLATLEDYFRRPIGPCMTAYENELGGRVVVCGYAPWIFVHSSAKRTQLLNAADWVTHGRLPVRIDETLPLSPIVRANADATRGAVVLLQHGLELVKQATLHLRAAGKDVRLVTSAGIQPLPTVAEPGGWWVRLEGLQPWTTTCLLWG